jgi:ELWxxDGT repeat protein
VKSQRTIAWAILLSLAATAALGREIQRLTTLNIAPVDASSSPAAFATVQGRMYFSATLGKPQPDQPQSPALYALRAGQRAAVEVASTGGSVVAATPTVAYYLAFDLYSVGLGASFFTLWRSDGTRDGTHPVSIGGQPAVFEDGGHDCAGLSEVNAGAETYLTDGCTFVEVDPVLDRVSLVVDDSGQPVAADGLALAGPVVLAFDRYDLGLLYALSPHDAVASVIRRGLPASTAFAAGTSRLFFIETLDSGATLWTSAGTRASTRQVANVPQSAGQLSVFGGEAYFVAEQDDGSQELWQSDATAAGTRVVARLGQEQSLGSIGLALGSRVLFFVEDRQTGAVELWTAADAPRTALALKTVCRQDCASGAFEVLGEVGGRALFHVGNESGGLALWSSDGTAAGTVLVRSLCQSDCTGETRFVPGGGLLYFGVAENSGGNQLWRSDGTEKGTFSLTGFAAGEGLADELGDAGDLGFLGASVFFNACDESHGCELWKSDGTPGGAVLAQNINTTAIEPAGALPALLAQLSSGIVFSACDHDVRSLWSIPQGSDEPLKLAALPQACAIDANAAGEVAAAGDFALVAANGNAVWRTDGLESGTFLLESFAGPSAAVKMTAVGNEVWFLACLDSGLELWRSDGSPAGTARFASLQDERACAGELAAVGQRLFFQLGDDLWTSDGTQAGTLLLAAPPGGTSFHRFVPFAGGLILSADDGSCTVCATTWRSDGTPAGTREIEAPGFVEAVVMGQQIYLLAADGLWRTDNRFAPAIKVVDFSILPQPGSADYLGCSRLAVLHGQLYFSFNSTQVLCALEKSNGTQGGTVFLRAVELSSDLFAVGPDLLFVGAEPFTQAVQLWQTDGTPSGTRVVEKLNAHSPDGAQPVILGTAAGAFFFSADDGLTGRQLYRAHS